MRFLATVMAVAIVLALPSAGETAQKKKRMAVRHAHPTVQHRGHLSFSVRGSRTAAGTPCVGYTWRGCLGWDPDPNIRAMLDMDRGRDDR